MSAAKENLVLDVGPNTAPDGDLHENEMKWNENEKKRKIWSVSLKKFYCLVELFGNHEIVIDWLMMESNSIDNMR
jgi:hypothetical protein